MMIQPLERSPESLLRRIDAILSELLSLRQEVQLLTQRERRLDQLVKPQRVDVTQSSVDIVDALYGSLGHGSPDEIEFDINTKWERFSQ